MAADPTKALRYCGLCGHESADEEYHIERRYAATGTRTYCDVCWRYGLSGLDLAKHTPGEHYLAVALSKLIRKIAIL